MEREASLQSAPNHVLPSDLCRMSLMKQLSATTTGNTMTAHAGGVLARRGGGDNGTTDLEGCNLRR